MGMLTKALAALGVPTWAFGAIVAAALGGAVWLYGNSRFNAGVTQTTQTFVNADQKGAQNVRTKANEILRDTVGLDDAAISDLLRSNGGLRPDD